MNASFRNLLGGVAVVLVFGVVFASPAGAQSPQEKAAQHALRGPEIKKLKVMGHEFNVKKAKVTNFSGNVTITGQLSHHLSYRPDDQIYYTIRKSGGKVTAVEMKIERGGLAPYAGKLAKHVIGVPLVEGAVEDLVRKFGRLADGSWESSAELIIATIALRSPGNNMFPVNPPPAVNRPSGATRPVIRVPGTTRPQPTIRVPGTTRPTIKVNGGVSVSGPEGLQVRDHRSTVSPVTRDHRRK